MNIRVHRKYIPLSIIIFFGLVYFFMGILNHYLFKTYAYDYGNYNFAFWDYSHFRINPIPTFRGTFLQDHFSFTLMYFIPVYWLLNWLTHTYTLIIIQNSLILIAAWYSYKIVRLKSDNPWLGAGVLIYFFMLLGRYTAFASDVNLAIISSCFIPIFIYYFMTRKYLLSMVILILSLFSRENIPIWFIFIFVILIIENRKEKTAVLYSLAGIVISVIYFILLFKVFIPSVETPGIKYALFNYSALGATPGEALIYIINHPIESIKLFFVNHLDNPAYNKIKAEFYWVYIISGGFVLFRKPQYFIWFIPIVAQKVLNDAPMRWGIATYYSVEVITILPLSVFLVLSSFKSKLIQNGLAIIVCIATILMTIYKMDAQNNQRVGVLFPAKTKIYDKRFFKAPFDVKEVNKLLDQIPPKAKVSASNRLLPHLAQRQHIYYFPNVMDAEYIVFSVFDNHYLYSPGENEKSRAKYFSDPNWEIVAKEFPVYLFKLNKALSSDVTRSNNKTHIDTLTCDFENINTDKEQMLLSDREKSEMKMFLSSEKSKSGNYSIKLDSVRKYGTRIKLEDLNNTDFIQMNAWGYTNEENQLHLVANIGKDITFHSVESDSISPSGWKKISLGFWIPHNTECEDASVFVWSSGLNPVYIDDIQIIRKTWTDY